VISLTRNEAFEEKLARSSDATVLRGKLLLQASSTSTPTVALAIIPSQLGVRATALGGIFTKYRVKSVLLKFMSANTSGTTLTGGGVLGFYDDATTGEGEAPTTAAGVLEQRCSASNFSGQTTPTMLRWEPVDKRLWYATTQGVAGSDLRLVFPGLIYIAGLASTTSVGFDIELDFTLVFKGAADVGAI
jgi:hypothetical protein